MSRILKMSKILKSNSLKKIGMIALAANLAACGNFNEFVGGDKVNYRAGLQTTSPLEIPPSVSQVQTQANFTAPDTQTFSQYVKKREAATTGVLTQSTVGRIEREGNKRWLVVNLPAQEVWPKLEKFWGDLGFQLEEKSPELGVMQTNWLENKAGVPNDNGLRALMSSLMTFAFSADKKDKFRTRIERAPNGETEIYITHSGVEEQFSDKKKETSKYYARPEDHDLVAEIYRKLIIELGMNKMQADYLAKNYLDKSATQNSNSNSTANMPAAQIQPMLDTFDTSAKQSNITQNNNIKNNILNNEQVIINATSQEQAARRLAMVLDRASFKIDDKKVYTEQPFWLISYTSPEQFNQQAGFWQRIKSGKNADELRKSRQFKITLTSNSNQNIYNVNVLPETKARDAQEEEINTQSKQRISRVLAEYLQTQTPQ